MPSIDYSLIIATYNRLEELKELFESIVQIDFPKDRFEVVVVDDGSTDRSEEYIEGLKTGFVLQYHRQENQGPGQARNLGMTKAQGTYFIFLDSDVILPKDYLTQIDHFLGQHRIDAFGGPDDAHASFSPLLKAINYAMTSYIGTGGTRGQEKSVTKFYPRSFNMGVHRRVFDTIGGMGTLRHGQDMDYSARIYQAGFKVALIPKAKVYHKRRTSYWRFFKQIFNWGVARINLGKMHPGLLKPIHFLPSAIIVIAFLLVLLAPFSSVAGWVLRMGFLFFFLIVLYILIDSSIRNKSMQVGFMSVIAIIIQVVAYGLGMVSGLFQMAMGRKKAVGIQKNYYK